MRLKLVLLLFILLILVSAPALAILQSGNMKIFAVTEDHKGIAADLVISTMPGSGKVAFITSSSLVGKDTQTTGNISLQVAQKKTGVTLSNNDLLFDIRANASEVDGPSAGAAMTLLVYSLLSEKQLQSNVAVTGTINNDGSIGMVGGVGPKSQAAAKAGIKLFLIPSGEAITEIEENGKMQTINLLEYGPQSLGLKVVEVSTIDQAVQYAYANIDDIKVDTNAINMQMFIPTPITYSPMLAPMKKISQGYIDEAKAVIEQAGQELEHSNISDELRGKLYSDHSSTKRSVEMARRFFDQNYLYSAANYAFNARVTAGAIKEIAQNPSMLSGNQTILDAKIADLRKDIALLKQKCNFVPLDGFEWIIAAQQRIAYAENALNKIENTMVVSVDVPGAPQSEQEKKDVQEALATEKVLGYVSAQSWIEVSKDFLKEAQKSGSKKIPVYSKDFISTIWAKLDLVGKKFSDLNISPSAKDEAQRRYDSAKISFDNNFMFAALYDAYFADAFVSAEQERKDYPAEQLFSGVEGEIKAASKSNSLCGNLFFDHAKLYYENALFNKSLGRTEEVQQSLETSYDLIFLSKQLAQAKNTIHSYLSSSQMADYAETEPMVGIQYTKTEDASQYLVIVSLVLSIILIALIMILGLFSRATREPKLTYDSRKAKLLIVLRNLDRALSDNRISDAEYFFMKKKYEQELKRKPNIKEDRKRLNLTLQDLYAKRRALEKGLVDLKRHYKEGLIIPEDYEHNYRQVRNEIEEIKIEERQCLNELRDQKQNESNTLSTSVSQRKALGNKIKGTKEMAGEEEQEEREEKEKRKAILKKYSSKTGRDS
jgi:uncharacterized protein